MSRWTDNFENHAFQQTWSEIKVESSKLIASDKTITTDVEEIARLKKAIKFLDEILASIDPELTPKTTWDNFQGQATPCLSQITSFQQNFNIAHINSANNNIDNLLSYLKPYLISNKAAAQAAGRAFSEYSKYVNKQIGVLSEEVETTLEKMKEGNKEVEEILGEIIDSKDKISTFENNLLSDVGDRKSLKTRLEETENTIAAWYAKIEKYHNKLTSGDEEESAIILQIEDAKKDSITDSTLIKDELENSSKLIQNLEKFHDQIFGVKNQDGELEGGLQKELEENQSSLNDYKENQEKTYTTLKEQIEGLLPGATSAGLASSFKKLKDSFRWPIWLYSFLFFVALIGILGASLFLITDASTTLETGKWTFLPINTSTPTYIFSHLIYKLPIMLPFLWLTIFSSKRRSEARRLQQEYAHKEALANSYHSFKKQVQEVSDKDDLLMKKLLNTAISALAFNASRTLDKNHSEKLPLQEIAEKIVTKANGLNIRIDK